MVELVLCWVWFYRIMNFYNATSLLCFYLRLVHFAYLSNSFTSWTNSTKEIAKKIQNFGCISNNGKLVMMGFGILVYKGKRKYEKRVILSKSLMRDLGEKLKWRLFIFYWLPSSYFPWHVKWMLLLPAWGDGDKPDASGSDGKGQVAQVIASASPTIAREEVAATLGKLVPNLVKWIENSN